MGRWSRLLAAAVTDWLEPAPGLRWVDVGCGTGALSQTLLATTAPRSVLGIDPTAAYVASAEATTADERAAFRVGDATALPLADMTVDEVVTGLVLNFVPDPVAAAREMRRVLVPGGRATAYVWDYADGMRMLRHFWDAAVAEDPAAADTDEGARFPLCHPGPLADCLALAGFEVEAARPIEIDTPFRDFDDYWQPFLGGQGPAPGYFAALTDGAKDRLRDRLRTDLPANSDGTIPLTARAWAISGRNASVAGPASAA